MSSKEIEARSQRLSRGTIACRDRIPDMSASGSRQGSSLRLSCACLMSLGMASSCNDNAPSGPVGSASDAGVDSLLARDADATTDASVVFDGLPDSGGGDQRVSPVVSYIPEMNYPFDDAYLVDGSFESSAGFGWDACPTRTPGQLSLRMSGQASHGRTSFRFQSGACALCRANQPSAQAYVWFNQAPPAGDPMGLYFDIINGEQAAPLGKMTFYGVDLVCEGDEPLADVPLGDLAPTSTWSTRCVNVSVVGFYPAIGVAVSGDAFNIGLDALRLGPPCQRPVDCSTTACICTPGLNQTCNDSLSVSSLHGACLPNGTCACHPGFAKNALTGKCL
jgi:hypothetical protein